MLVERSRKKFTESRLSRKANATQHRFKAVFDYSDKFSKDYKCADFDELIVKLRKTTDDDIIEVLQDWINKLKLSPSTIVIYFSAIRKYLGYMGIKLDSSDVKDGLEFPTIIEEDRHPLQLDEIHRLLEGADHQRRGFYLFLLSSGLRPAEALQLRKKDLQLKGKNYMLKVRGGTTKKKRDKTTFCSRECNRFLTPILHKLEDDDLIWTKNPIMENARRNEDQIFQNLIERLGMTEKFETGKYKINLYCFRAYFITKASRHDHNIAKMFAGQKGYMLQYDRLTPEEKLEKYLEIEPDLLVYDFTKKDEKIAELESKNQRISSLENKQKLTEDALNTLMYVANGKSWGYTDQDIDKLWKEFIPKFNKVLKETK